MHLSGERFYRLPRFLHSPPIASLVVAGLYATVAQAGFALTTMPGHIAPIFPAAGIALAAVLMLGWPAVVGVWLGSLAGNMLAYFLGPAASRPVLAEFWVDAWVAIGPAAGAGVGAFLVRWLCRETSPLFSVRNILALILVGALGGCLISSTIGVICLALSGAVPLNMFGYAWLTWWLGDAVGAIIAAPFILAWFQVSPFHFSLKRLVEAVGLGGLTLLWCGLVFFGPLHFEYGLMPLLLWAAFRFGLRGASLTAAGIAILATVGTAHGTGPFVGETVNESLLQLYSFLGVTIVCALWLSGALAERRRARETLQESEARLRSLSDNLPAGFVYQIDSGMAGEVRQFTYVSAGVEKLHGVTAAAVLQDAQRLYGQMVEADRAQLAAQEAQAQAQMTTFTAEARFRLPSGEIHWCLLTSAPRRLPNGHLIWDGVEIDITARKRAEEALRASHQLRERTLASLRDAVFIIDAKTTVITDCNPAATEIFGYSREDMLGKATSFLHVDQVALDEFRKHLSVAMAEKGFLFLSGFKMKRKDGTVFPTEHTVLPLVDEQGGQIGWVSVVRDITERKRAEDALREIESRYRLISENTADVIWTLSLQTGKFAYVSDSVQKLRGYTPEEVLQQTMADALTPESLQTATHALQQSMAQRKPGDTSRHKAINLVDQPCKDGSVVSTEAVSTVVFNEQGQPVEVIGVSRDITERKQAEAALRFQRALLAAQNETNPDGILTVNPEGKIIYYNQPFVELWQIPPEVMASGQNEVVLQSVAGQLTDPAGFLERVQQLSAIPKERVREELTFKDGRVFEQYTAPVTGADGAHYGRIWFFRNITERRRLENLILAQYTEMAEQNDRLIAAEAGLRQLNMTLEERIAQRTVELAAAKEAAEIAAAHAASANRAKSTFLANMSHELRTPLHAILGFAQLAARDPALSETTGKHLAIINRSGEHLLDMINDVLDLSKIEAGRTELQPEVFDLPQTLHDIGEMIRSRAEAKGLTFCLEPALDLPRYVRTDLGKLRQILINLLGNSVKFTREGGVTLKAKEEERRMKDEKTTSFIVFSVCDTGIGIPADRLEAIFEPFTQAGSKAVGQQGTGLGLTISRDCARMLGGDITAESVVGQGSIFRVALPLELAAPDEAPAPVPLAPAVAGLEPGQPEWRILIAEDNAESRLLLETQLAQAGFAVRTAVNGEEAVAMARAWQPHLIWMDMRMPVMDGYEATQQIRALPGGDPMRIVALTASAFKDQEGRIRAVGCDDVMLKPYQPHQLFETMARLLGVRYLYDEASASPVAPQRQLPPTPAELAALPPESLRALRAAAQEASRKKVLALVDALAAEHPAVAAFLRQEALAYRFETLVALGQE